MNFWVTATASALIILGALGMPADASAKCVQQDRLPSFDVMSAACREKTGMEAISIIMDGYGLLFEPSADEAQQKQALQILQTAAQVSKLPAPAAQDVKRTVFENKTPGVCVNKMQLGVGGIVYLTATKACPDGLNGVLAQAAGAGYTPGSNGGIDGGTLDFSKIKADALPKPTYKTFEEEADIFWNRLCEDKVLAKYKEICQTNLTPAVYQIICENEDAKKDAKTGYVEEQKQQTIRDILQNGFQMAVTSRVENKTLSDESIMHVERITTRPGGQMEVELCPMKQELSDIIISGLQRGEVYKTQTGFVVELKDEIDTFLKEYADKAKQQGEKND